MPADDEFKRTATRLILDLEKGRVPFDESTYRPQIEQVIADLMKHTFESKDREVKMFLASLEYRARLIRERLLKDKNEEQIDGVAFGASTRR
jgi:hypothetical protein